MQNYFVIYHNKLCNCTKEAGMVILERDGTVRLVTPRPGRWRWWLTLLAGWHPPAPLSWSRQPEAPR